MKTAGAAFLGLLVGTQVLAAALPSGSFEGRTNRNEICYYSLKNNSLAIGYEPNNHPWEQCSIAVASTLPNDQNPLNLGNDYCKVQFHFGANGRVTWAFFRIEDFGAIHNVRCSDFR